MRFLLHSTPLGSVHPHRASPQASPPEPPTSYPPLTHLSSIPSSPSIRRSLSFSSFPFFAPRAMTRGRSFRFAPDEDRLQDEPGEETIKIAATFIIRHWIPCSATDLPATSFLSSPYRFSRRRTRPFRLFGHRNAGMYPSFQSAGVASRCDVTRHCRASRLLFAECPEDRYEKFARAQVASVSRASRGIRRKIPTVGPVPIPTSGTCPGHRVLPLRGV